MRFLYTTDLHGNTEHYQFALETARRLGIRYVHLGADMLPKTGSTLEEMQHNQSVFIRKFLSKYFAEAREAGIELLCFFGNDDFWYLKPLFREVCETSLLDDTPVRSVGEYSFVTYPYVPDYPFTMKTACKRDARQIVEPYLGLGFEVDDDGQRMPIINPDQHFADKGTIDADLKTFCTATSWAMKRTVASFHTPPSSLGLDVCGGGRQVGSRAVHDWIEEQQPILVLAGHIHESPALTGIWRARINNSTVVQPGRSYTPRVVEVTLLPSASPIDTVLTTLHEKK
jgi:Icc-related predicted phosphoesterase